MFSHSFHQFLWSNVLPWFPSLLWSFPNVIFVLPIFHGPWGYHQNSFSIIQNICNFFLVLFCFFGGCVIFSYVAIDPSWNIYQNNHFKTYTKLHVFFLSSNFPSNIFFCIFGHLSNSLHNLLNINYSQSTSNPSSTFMNVNSFLLFM